MILTWVPQQELIVRTRKESTFTSIIWEENSSEIRCSTIPAMTCSIVHLMSILSKYREKQKYKQVSFPKTVNPSSKQQWVGFRAKLLTREKKRAVFIISFYHFCTFISKMRKECKNSQVVAQASKGIDNKGLVLMSYQ